MNSLFSNVGGKIKILAKCVFVIEALAAIIAGISLISVSTNLITIALVLILVGPVVALCTAWFLYGFGELIEKATAIESNTRREMMPGQKTILTSQNIDRGDLPNNDELMRSAKLLNLLDKGLISKEEYDQMCSSTNK